jgi:hypothetical protein
MVAAPSSKPEAKWEICEIKDTGGKEAWFAGGRAVRAGYCSLLGTILGEKNRDG